MATEIRVGGVKYELAGTSDQGNVYVIQQSAETEVLPDIKHQETAIQTANGEVSVADPSPGKVRVWYIQGYIFCIYFLTFNTGTMELYRKNPGILGKIPPKPLKSRNNGKKWGKILG